MPSPELDAHAEYREALTEIRKILDPGDQPVAPGEKLVRIECVILGLSHELRDTVMTQAQQRVIRGWERGRRATDL